MSNRYILVTGGTGFIGSHLVEELVNKNFKVVVVDIKIHPNSYFLTANLKNKIKLELVDIRNRKRIESIFLKYKPKAVFHLAAEPIVENAFSNPFSTFETNIMGTVNILEASRKIKDLDIVIVASSDKAYGKTKSEYTEESPLKGDHPYDVSKSCEDLITYSYYKTYNLPVVITRFGNVFGEGDFHLSRIIPGICNAIIKKETFFIRSDGTYIRDYLYVKDVVNGYLFLLNNFKKVKGEAYNFSSKENLSVLEIVEKISNILKIKIEYKILNNVKNEIPYQHLNDRKIRSLGWKSNFDFESTLLNVLNWHRFYVK